MNFDMLIFQDDAHNKGIFLCIVAHLDICIVKAYCCSLDKYKYT